MFENSRKMSNKLLRSVKCPNEELTLTNCVIVNPKEFESIRHIEIIEASRKFIFSIRADNNVPLGDVGFSAVQRKWANVSLESKLMVRPFSFDLRTQSISIMTVEVDFLTKKMTNLDPYDTDKLAPDLLQQFSNQAFTVGQQFAFQPTDKSKKILLATVKSIEAIDLGTALSNQSSKPNKIVSGQLLPNSSIIFEKFNESSINLIGKNKGYFLNLIFLKKNRIKFCVEKCNTNQL